MSQILAIMSHLTHIKQTDKLNKRAQSKAININLSQTKLSSHGQGQTPPKTPNFHFIL